MNRNYTDNELLEMTIDELELSNATDEDRAFYWSETMSMDFTADEDEVVESTLTFDDVVAAHPDSVKRICQAFAVVTMNPERDIEVELSDLNLTEEELFAINKKVIETRYGA